MLTQHVERMFPISFARQAVYGARSLSESNLISWLQHFSPDSETPHTFMITESIPETFGLPLPDHATSNMSVEFIIGGYYVRLSDRYFTDDITNFNTSGEQITSYYAYINFITNGEHDCFTTLSGGEAPVGSDVHFTALSIEKNVPTDAAYYIHLFDLKQTNTVSGESVVKSLEYIIPRTSLRTIDGGEI